MKKIMCFMLFAIAMLISSVAMAVESGQMYTGFTFVSSDADIEGYNSAGMQFPFNTLGYKMNDTFYIQATVLNQGDGSKRYELYDDSVERIYADYKADLKSIDIQLLAHVPVNNNIAVFGSIGANVWDISERYTKFKYTYPYEEIDPVTGDPIYIPGVSEIVSGTINNQQGVSPIYGIGIEFDLYSGAELQVSYTVTEIDVYDISNVRMSLLIPF